MDTSVWIWIIVGVLVVGLIVVGVIWFTRGREEQRRRAEHEKAEKLRAEARESELAAREGEARAAQVRADAATAAAASQQAQAQAAQADVDARRLEDSVGEHEAEAAKHRAAQEQTLRKADDVDPFVTTSDEARDDTVRADAAVRENPALRDEMAAPGAGAAIPDATAGEQPITRPPASRPVPTVTEADADVPPTRRDRADTV